MQRTWEVQVEAATLDGERLDPASDALAVLNNLLGGAASVVAEPNRYAAAVPVRADTADQARRTAIRAFQQAASMAGLPDWPVVEVAIRHR